MDSHLRLTGKGDRLDRRQPGQTQYATAGMPMTCPAHVKCRCSHQNNATTTPLGVQRVACAPHVQCACLQARLVSLIASYQLDCSVAGVQERLQQLVHVLPDLGQHCRLLGPMFYKTAVQLMLLSWCTFKLYDADCICSNCLLRI